MRELETVLRNIRLAVRGAVDAVTGKVDPSVLGAQAALLKKWTDEFEKNYVVKQSQKPLKRAQIRIGGKKIAEHAWFCCEVLWNAEIDAAGPPPVMSRWEGVPSGLVVGDIKGELDTEITKLLNDFIEYRREVLQE